MRFRFGSSKTLIDVKPYVSHWNVFLIVRSVSVLLSSSLTSLKWLMLFNAWICEYRQTIIVKNT